MKEDNSDELNTDSIDLEPVNVNSPLNNSPHVAPRQKDQSGVQSVSMCKWARFWKHFVAIQQPDIG